VAARGGARVCRRAAAVRGGPDAGVTAHARPTCGPRARAHGSRMAQDADLGAV